jgi:hypothetical protein
MLQCHVELGALQLCGLPLLARLSLTSDLMPMHCSGFVAKGGAAQKAVHAQHQAVVRHKSAHAFFGEARCQSLLRQPELCMERRALTFGLAAAMGVHLTPGAVASSLALFQVGGNSGGL